MAGTAAACKPSRQQPVDALRSPRDGQSQPKVVHSNSNGPESSDALGSALDCRRQTLSCRPAENSKVAIRKEYKPNAKQPKMLEASEAAVFWTWGRIIVVVLTSKYHGILSHVARVPQIIPRQNLRTIAHRSTQMIHYIFSNKFFTNLIK